LLQAAGADRAFKRAAAVWAAGARLAFEGLAVVACARRPHPRRLVRQGASVLSDGLFDVISSLFKVQGVPAGEAGELDPSGGRGSDQKAVSYVVLDVDRSHEIQIQLGSGSFFSQIEDEKPAFGEDEPTLTVMAGYRHVCRGDVEDCLVGTDDFWEALADPSGALAGCGTASLVRIGFGACGQRGTSFLSVAPRAPVVPALWVEGEGSVKSVDRE